MRFVEPGELLAELDALGGKPFNRVMRHDFGLSPLDVDSDRCRGREALRRPIPVEAAAEACNSEEAAKLGSEYRSSAGAGYCW